MGLVLPLRSVIVVALVVAALPLGGAHNESGTYPVTDANDKPSGIYVGSAGAYAIGIVANAKAQASLVGSRICDLEVTDGTAPQPTDESAVDGGSGGAAPDGTWDDGGYGGVCHVSAYAHASYNTAGCDNGRAWARDDVVGDRVWIGAACDSTTRIDPSTLPYANHLLASASCQVGAVIGNLDPVPCLTDALLAIFCAQQGHPPTWATSQPCPAPPPPGGLACGPDGVPDAMNFGSGDGSWAPWVGGVPYPAVHPGCSDADGVASVYTWDAVQLGNGSPDRLVLATRGWIN